MASSMHGHAGAGDDGFAALPKDLPILIVEAPYYADIADGLRAGALAVANGVAARPTVVRVAGALEIPQALGLLLTRGGFAAAACLGCIIRGETYHFEIVANESARGVMDVALRTNVPVGNGILTVNTLAQAQERADPHRLNKGAEAMRAALSVLALGYGAKPRL